MTTDPVEQLQTRRREQARRERAAKRPAWEALQREVPEAVELVTAFGKRGWLTGLAVVKDDEEVAGWQP